MKSPHSGIISRIRSNHRAGQGFTLVELVVVLVVVGILAGIAAFAYSSVQSNSTDRAGAPALGAVQAEARKLASANSYKFPTDLTTKLETVDGDANTTNLAPLTFKTAPDPSTAPAQAGSTSFNISVGTWEEYPTHAGYAVRTSAPTASKAGSCWVLYDRTSTPSSDNQTAAMWFHITDTTDAPVDCAPTYCLMVSADSMPGLGTATEPKTGSSIPAEGTCAAPPGTPWCVTATPTGTGPYGAALAWHAPRGSTLANVTGYTVYRYRGAVSFDASTADDAAVNKLPAPFATGSDPATVTTGPGVTVTSGGAGAKNGENGFKIVVPKNQVNKANIVSSPVVNTAPWSTPSSQDNFSVWAARDAAVDFDVAISPRIEWFKANGQPSDVTPSQTGVASVLTKAWQQINVTGVQPSDATRVRVSLVAETNVTALLSDATILADSFLLEPGSTPTAAALPTPEAQFVVNGSSTLTATDPNLTSGETYSWAVVANSAGGSSTVADLIATQQALPAITVLPGMVGGASATQTQTTTAGTTLENKEIQVRWNASAGATQYKIDRKLASAADTAYAVLTTVPAQTGTAVYTYNDESVVFGENYSYRITASNPVLASSVCGQIVTSGGTVVAPPPPSPFIFPNAPVIDGDAVAVDPTPSPGVEEDDPSGTRSDRANLLHWTPPAGTESASQTPEYEVSLKNAEGAGAWTPARSYTDGGWLPCATGNSPASAVDTNCLYGGPERTSEANSVAQTRTSSSTPFKNRYSNGSVKLDNQVSPGSKIYYRIRTLVENNSAGVWARSCWSTQNPTTTASGALVPSCATKAGTDGQGLVLTQPLDTPQVTPTVTGTNVSLSWPAIDGATGYIIYRTDNGVSLPDAPANRTFTSPNIAGALTKGTYNTTTSAGTGGTWNNSGNVSLSFSEYQDPSAFDYFVVATRIVTDVWSNPSDAASAVVAGSPPDASCVVQVGTYNIAVTWTATSGATGYKVYSRDADNNSSPWQQRGPYGWLPSNQLSFTDTNLGPRAARIYKVVAVVTFQNGEQREIPLATQPVNPTLLSPTCETAGLAKPVVETGFWDAQGNNLQNDQGVAFNAVPTATAYAVYPNGMPTSLPANINGNEIGNASNLPGTLNVDYVLVWDNTGQATRYPANKPSPTGKNWTGKIVVGYTNIGSPGFAAHMPAMANRQVFQQVGKYQTYNVSVVALIANTTSPHAITDFNSNGTLTATPIAGTPPEPQSISSKPMYYNGAVWTQTSWANGGSLLAEWYTQPYALIGWQAYKTRNPGAAPDVANQPHQAVGSWGGSETLEMCNYYRGPASSYTSLKTVITSNASYPRLSGTCGEESVGQATTRRQALLNTGNHTQNEYMNAIAYNQLLGYRVVLYTMLPTNNPAVPALRASNPSIKTAVRSEPQGPAVVNATTQKNTSYVHINLAPSASGNPSQWYLFHTDPSAGASNAGSDLRIIGGTTYSYTFDEAAVGTSYSYVAVARNDALPAWGIPEGWSTTRDTNHNDGSANGNFSANQGVYVELRDNKSGGYVRRPYNPAGAGFNFYSFTVRGVAGYCIDYALNSPESNGGSLYATAPTVRNQVTRYRSGNAIPAADFWRMSYMASKWGVPRSGPGAPADGGQGHYRLISGVIGHWMHDMGTNNSADQSGIAKLWKKDGKVWGNTTRNNYYNMVVGDSDARRGPYAFVSSYPGMAAGVTSYAHTYIYASGWQGSLGAVWFFAAPTNGPTPAPQYVYEPGGGVNIPINPSVPGNVAVPTRALGIPDQIYMWNPSGNGQRLIQAGRVGQAQTNSGYVGVS